MPCPCGSAQPTRARRLCAARVSAQAPRRASLCSQSTSTSTRRLRALQSLVTGPPRRNYALCRSDCSPGSKPRLWGLRHRQGRSCRANEGRPERHPWAAPRLWSLKQFIHHLFALGSLVAPHIVAWAMNYASRELGRPQPAGLPRWLPARPAGGAAPRAGRPLAHNRTVRGAVHLFLSRHGQSISSFSQSVSQSVCQRRRGSSRTGKSNGRQAALPATLPGAGPDGGGPAAAELPADH
jgi:hypothetical protein